MDQQATNVGIAQIVSGVINLIIMSLGWALLGTGVGGTVSAALCAIVSLGTCPAPIGVVCGFVGILPLVLGLLEIISGALIISDTERFRSFGRAIAILEVLSVLYGGVASVLVGAFALTSLKAPSAGEDF
jgi:hypothetical protein